MNFLAFRLGLDNPAIGFDIFHSIHVLRVFLPGLEQGFLGFCVFQHHLGKGIPGPLLFLGNFEGVLKILNAVRAGKPKCCIKKWPFGKRRLGGFLEGIQKSE